MTINTTAELIETARREALEEVRDRIMSLQADTDGLKAERRQPFRDGHAAARYAARDLITGMLSK